MTQPLLVCHNVYIAYGDRPPTVSGAGLTIGAGECVALVGQSGSGKTTIARAILGLLPPGARVSGQLSFAGVDLPSLDERAYRQLRGKQIGYVAQDPYQACDPLQSVHAHVAAAWHVHAMRPAPGQVRQRLDNAGIGSVDRAMHQYPHQWSGGMLQRASIAAATAHVPRLLVADEPTSALDAERADAIIGALKATGSAILLISHDLDLVMRHADRIAFCHQGRITETGTAGALAASRDEHARAFVSALSKPRSTRPAIAGDVQLSARGLAKSYRAGGDRRMAVDGCDITLARGEILGISGPSGCGKSTLLRLLAGLEATDRGSLHKAKALDRPGAIMPVFQDPAASLDARWPIWRSLVEPLTAPHLERLSRSDLRARARNALAALGLADIDLDAMPGELSSGQCQRVSVARALIAEPFVVLADEPTSALDTLAKRQVLDLLVSAAGRGTAIVLVSHDRTMLDNVADRVLIMHQGRLVDPV